MLNNLPSSQYIKKKRNPDLEPFIIQKFSYLKLFSVLVFIPILISLLLTALIFYKPTHIVLGLLTGFSIITFICCFCWIILKYRTLTKYQLKGSIVDNLSILLESSLLKFRSLIFPLFLFMIFASFLIPGTQASTKSTSSSNVDYGLIISFAGIIVPFLGLISIDTLFFDYVDNTNNRVHDLSEKLIPEEFRTEIKEIGKKIGFHDVKIRLGDLFPDDYCNHSWGIISKNNTTLIVYSNITFQKATKVQNTILITRELYRLKNRNINGFILAGFIRNLIHILSFLLMGVLVINLSQATWNKWFIFDNQSDFLMFGLIIVQLLFSSFFLKIYLDSMDLLNELKSDSNVITAMRDETHSIQDFKSALFQVSKLNPLIVETRGLNLRSNAFNYLFPEQDKPKKTGITWDDI